MYSSEDEEGEEEASSEEEAEEDPLSGGACPPRPALPRAVGAFTTDTDCTLDLWTLRLRLRLRPRIRLRPDRPCDISNLDYRLYTVFYVCSTRPFLLAPLPSSSTRSLFVLRSISALQRYGLYHREHQRRDGALATLRSADPDR